MEQAKPLRVHFIDELRGLAMIVIILYHLFYDLVYLFGVSVPWYETAFVHDVIQPLSAGTFVFISGVVSRYSRSNLRRGAETFALGIAIWVVTLVFMPGGVIRFGVLSLLGSGMMMHGFLDEFLPELRSFRGDSILPALLGGLSLIFFAVTYGVSSGYLGFFNTPLVSLPAVLYSTNFFNWLGFRHSSFQSADYFPLLPWIFLFFAGSYFGIYFAQNRASRWFYKERSSLLSFIGNHSLAFYLIHQPLIYGVLTLVFWGK